MPSDSPEDRAMISRIASLRRWALTNDRRSATAPARRGLREKFADEIDPARALPTAERERRVDQLLRAHMLQMSRKAAQARSRRQRANDDLRAAQAALSELGCRDDLTTKTDLSGKPQAQGAATRGDDK
jgi:hypothetical protein